MSCFTIHAHWWMVTVQCWWEGSLIAGLWPLLPRFSSNDWGASDSLDFRNLHFGVSWSASIIAHTSRCTLHTRCFSGSGEVTGFLVPLSFSHAVPLTTVQGLSGSSCPGWITPQDQSISKVVLLCLAWPPSRLVWAPRGGSSRVLSDALAGVILPWAAFLDPSLLLSYGFSSCPYLFGGKKFPASSKTFFKVL